MGKKKKRKITLIEFGVLHELTVEKCYPADAETVINWSKVELYGHNPTASNPRSNSIRAIVGLESDPRLLYEAAKSYNEGTLESISAQLVKELFEFLGYNSFEEMVNQYLSDRQIKLADCDSTQGLKYHPKDVINKKKSNDSRLENLAETEWWCYSHFPSKGSDSSKILRLKLKIHSQSHKGDYGVSLYDEKPYTTFHGKILKKYSSGSVLTCELTSVDKTAEKRLYLLIHVGITTSKNLYIGCFLRHTDSGRIFSGSFIMQKIKANSSESGQRLRGLFPFKKGSEDLECIFNFLHDRYLNHLKIPSSIYTRIDLEDWLKEKSKMLGRRIPKYDLYITAPFRSFTYQLNRYRKLKDELMQEVDMVMGKDYTEENQFLKTKIDHILRKHLTVSISDSPSESFETLHEQIAKMVERLKSAPIGFKNIWYPPLTEDFSPYSIYDSSVELMNQLSKFNQSSRLLFIFPRPMVSSVLVEVGWAMLTERNIPVFMVADRKDLPFLLKKADTLKNRHIYLISWEEIGSIENIPDWIQANNYHHIPTDSSI